MMIIWEIWWIWQFSITSILNQTYLWFVIHNWPSPYLNKTKSYFMSFLGQFSDLKSHFWLRKYVVLFDPDWLEIPCILTHYHLHGIDIFSFLLNLAMISKSGTWALVVFSLPFEGRLRTRNQMALVKDLKCQSWQGTMVDNSQGSRRKYWATCSSVCSFARTAHLFVCSALLASLARSLARSLTHCAHSLNHGKVND